MNRGFAPSARLTGLAVMVLLAFVAVGVQLVNLQVISREARLHDINHARHKLEIEPARRGDILDAHGDALATSRTKVALAIDPWVLAEALGVFDKEISDLVAAKKTREAADKLDARAKLLRTEQAKHVVLASLLHLRSAEIEQLFVNNTREPTPVEAAEFAKIDPNNWSAADHRKFLKDGRVKERFVKFNDGVDEALFANLMDEKLYPQINAKALPTPPLGLVGERYAFRVYPHEQLAAHVVGYLNQ